LSADRSRSLTYTRDPSGRLRCNAAHGGQKLRQAHVLHKVANIAGQK